MASINLAIPHVAASQNQKEVTINSGFDAIDAVLTEALVVNLSGGDAAVTAAQASRNQVIRCTGNAVARTVTLPQIKRELVLVNQGTAALSVARGTTTIAIPAGATRRVYLDGSANGMIETGGGSGGIAEAPADGKTYGRKNGAWSEVQASPSGVPEAPVDGKIYARKDGAWSEVPAGAVYAAGAGLGLTGNQFNITDAELTAIMTLDSSVGGVPMFTGPGTAKLLTVSPAAETLLDDTTTAAMLATLGAFPAAGGAIAGDVFQTSGSFISGASAPFATRSGTIAVTPTNQVLSTSANGSSMLVARFSNDGSQPRISMAKSRGSSVGAHAAVQAGDALGEISVGGSNGTVIAESARITFLAEEAPGSNYTPGRISFSTAPSGGATGPAERVRITPAGDLCAINSVLVGGAFVPVAAVYTVSAITPQLQVNGAGNAAAMISRFGASASPPIQIFAKSRGASVGAHGAVQVGDQLGVTTWCGSDGIAMRQGARMYATVMGAPGATYVPTSLTYVVSDGVQEIAAFGADQFGNLTLGGPNVVIGANRHQRLRSYTTATLPAASTATEMIYVSDGAGGLRQAVSDGATWRLPNGQDASLPAINTQTGASYTLTLADMFRRVEMNNAAPNTAIVPPNSAVAFPVGVSIEVVQTGAGQTAIAAGAGVTIRSVNSNLKLSGQYAGAVLQKRATDEWVLIGSLAA